MNTGICQLDASSFRATRSVYLIANVFLASVTTQWDVKLHYTIQLYDAATASWELIHAFRSYEYPNIVCQNYEDRFRLL